jgi:hypothetical protein
MSVVNSLESLRMLIQGLVENLEFNFVEYFDKLINKSYISLHRLKIAAKTWHILSRIRLASRKQLLLGTPLFVIKYRTIMILIRPVELVSTKSEFPLWAPSARTDTFLKIPPVEFYYI